MDRGVVQLPVVATDQMVLQAAVMVEWVVDPGLEHISKADAPGGEVAGNDLDLLEIDANYTGPGIGDPGTRTLLRHQYASTPADVPTGGHIVVAQNRSAPP
jgi:hypothetical protein